MRRATVNFIRAFPALVCYWRYSIILLQIKRPGKIKPHQITPLMNTICKCWLLFISILFFTSSSYAQTNGTDSATIKKQDSLPHATLYFYRSFVPVLLKSVKKIPIYVNDSLVYNLKSNNYIAVKIFKEGTFTVAVDKKGNTETQVKVKFGKEYFFKCDGLGGFVNFRTVIDLVTPAEGKKATGVLTTE